MFGFLNIKKSCGQTSREAVDVVSRAIRSTIGRRLKLGHAGTLDPLADGVLVLAVGPATRLIHFVQQQPKSYIGKFQLGVWNETLDLENELIPVEDAPSVLKHNLESALGSFVGQIEQVPPIYSANKFEGKRGYVLARQGKPVNPKPKSVEIKKLELVEFQDPHFTIRVECGSGTYIRSLGRDIAQHLGTKAVMLSLTRTAIGPFQLDDSIDLDNDSSLFEQIEQKLCAPGFVLADMCCCQLTESQLKSVFYGTKLDLPDSGGAEQLAGFDSNNHLIAVFERASDGTYRPAINFSSYYGKERSAK